MYLSSAIVKVLKLLNAKIQQYYRLSVYKVKYGIWPKDYCVIQNIFSNVDNNILFQKVI